MVTLSWLGHVLLTWSRYLEMVKFSWLGHAMRWPFNPHALFRSFEAKYRNLVLFWNHRDVKVHAWIFSGFDLVWVGIGFVNYHCSMFSLLMNSYFYYITVQFATYSSFLELLKFSQSWQTDVENQGLQMFWFPNSLIIFPCNSSGQFQKFKDIAKMCFSDVKPFFYIAELKQKIHQLVITW